MSVNMSSIETKSVLQERLGNNDSNHIMGQVEILDDFQEQNTGCCTCCPKSRECCNKASEASISSLQQTLYDQQTQLTIEINEHQAVLFAGNVTSAQIIANQKALQSKMGMLQITTAQIRLMEYTKTAKNKHTLLQTLHKLQTGITYLFYITFTLNAFLTGFGIASSSE